MRWISRQSALNLSELENPVDKAGATESVAIVAIIWGVVIVLA